METLLDVRNLSIEVSVNASWLQAVEDINFTVYAGEILGIVGESGCGKSLTALSIPGLLPRGARRQGGSVWFEGRDLTVLGEKELRPLRGRDITMVFQEPLPSLNPLMRTGRQIAETLELHGYRDRDLNRKKVLELMGQLGLPDPERLFNAYPHQLSGGMCQRVMLALALIGGPKLLIADEPTTALDQDTGGQILSLISLINRERGTSVLCISHDLSVIQKVCSRVLVMYAGRIVEEGPVEAVFSRPAHEYTRLLLGAIPDRRRKGQKLANIPGRVPSLEERSGGCPFSGRCPGVLDLCLSAFPEKKLISAGGSAADSGGSGAKRGEHSSRCVLYSGEYA
ncbi:MAG: ABC transporter ATP-binding protein [Spirochaetaceae bacterium]|jgi:peptide/nickel transport system ATP-binding protein|nr:ABC transporter ATP-binding protein [Spirochaetaceae bacterium]